jgi:hypothetical protein
MVNEPEIPDDAVRAYGRAYDTASLKAYADNMVDLTLAESMAIRSGLAAAYPILAEQIRRQIDGGPDHHIIDLREDGWTIQHPLSCRPDLFACPVNRAAGQALTEPPDVLGRFPCRVGENGKSLIIGPPDGSP